MVKYYVAHFTVYQIFYTQVHTMPMPHHPHMRQVQAALFSRNLTSVFIQLAHDNQDLIGDILDCSHCLYRCASHCVDLIMIPIIHLKVYPTSSSWGWRGWGGSQYALLSSQWSNWMIDSCAH